MLIPTSPHFCETKELFIALVTVHEQTGPKYRQNHSTCDASIFPIVARPNLVLFVVENIGKGDYHGLIERHWGLLLTSIKPQNARFGTDGRVVCVATTRGVNTTARAMNDKSVSSMYPWNRCGLPARAQMIDAGHVVTHVYGPQSDTILSLSAVQSATEQFPSKSIMRKFVT